LRCVGPSSPTYCGLDQIIAIAANDPMAAEVNDVADVEAKMPGVISGIREWFRWYKTPDGKPVNAFGFDDKCLDKKHALEVIAETHVSWKGLMAGTIPPGKLSLK
jgi:inorganic pyrophosphatase